MRVRYRPEGDRILLRLEDDVDDEPRLWKLLATMGAPTFTEAIPGQLMSQRWVPKEQFPKVERAARMIRWELMPEAGEAVVAAPTHTRAAYVAARPLDPAPLLEAAKADPDQAELLLGEALKKLVDWMRLHPAYAREAQADAAALNAGLSKAQAAAKERAQAEQSEEARELALTLRGVAGEDAFAAHAALKRLQDAVKNVGPPLPPLPAQRMPEHIAHFRGKLRPYQVEGVKFLLQRGLNAILADEMGLGKTIESIAAVEAANERALVVGPANVLYNWRDEILRFTDEEPAIYHEQRFMGPRDARFLITTYDALRNLGTDAEEVVRRPVLILDEAHYIRNPETLRSKLVRALPQKRRILLTGTPLVNSIEDYYELLRQVETERWGSRAQFKETWLVDPSLFNKYTQVRSLTATLLQRAAKDVMLRRRKDDVLPDLPPRTVSARHHELPIDKRIEYTQLEARAEEMLRSQPHNELAVFAAIHALRQCLANARVPVVLERLQELLEAGESVVVYSHYLEPLRVLQRELGPGVGAMIEGATPPKERQALAKRFGTKGQERVLLAQMEAGGIGLNFTASRHVVFVHFGWTPAVHQQAMDRVHRIGQDRPVFVEFFVTPATIDERMVKILLRKEADQNLVLADEGDLLNRNEVARLLAEDAARRVREAKEAMGMGMERGMGTGPEHGRPHGAPGPSERA